LPRGLIKSFSRTIKTEFKNNIPTNLEVFLTEVGLFKRFSKFLTRYSIFYFRGHKKFEIKRIDERHKKILWINISATSLGDSLMDLSSRVMLQNKEIDLLTDQKNECLYQYDKFFKNVFTVGSIDIKKNYDLVILDSYSSRSLKIKYQYAKNVVFVGMYGFFNGCDVNRTLYSFYQMNYLLGSKSKEKIINEIAKPYLYLGKENFQIVENFFLSKKFVSFALGGDWQYRKYENWELVIEKIFETDPNIKIILLGSKNGLDSEQKIKKRFGEKIISFVDKLSFLETSAIIKKSELIFCSDGGLMHAAHSLNTPTISLFARVKPEMRTTNQIKNISIFDPSNVNNIKPYKIFRRYLEFYPLL